MLEYIKQEADMTTTENGAVTYASTGSECLDLFATIGALRRQNEKEIIARFIRAYVSDEEANERVYTMAYSNGVSYLKKW